MKWLLLITFWHLGYEWEVMRYEVTSEVDCQIQGRQMAEETLSHIPGVESVTYKCVERKYRKISDE